MAKQGDSQAVINQVVDQLEFDVYADNVPWDGGALFVPSIQWNKDDARSLVGSLIRWNLWCDIKGKSDEQRQIHNNIRSLGLANAAGYQIREAVTECNSWLVAWGKAMGKDEIESILQQQNVDGDDEVRRKCWTRSNKPTDFVRST